MRNTAVQNKKLLYQILSKRDYSGNPEDEYAQNIEGFHHHSLLQGKENDFLDLVKESVAQNKKITLDPAFEKEMNDNNYSEIPFEKLILV